MTTKVNVNTFRKDKCRYCDRPLDPSFLDLGSIALANSFISREQLSEDELTCPLSLTFCPQCSLIQLTHVVPADYMFSNYLYVSSTTQTFKIHFAEYAKEVRKKLSRVKEPLAVDIGSNDGLLVSCYQKEGMKAVGIEPAKNLSDAANKNGIKTINRYFDAHCVEDILNNYGPAHAISGNNVFAHIDDIQSVLKNVNKLLADDGLLVLEFPYLVTMLDDMVFDMIYHEHLSYISVNALKYVTERFGLKIFDIQYVSSHGGSLRVFIEKKNGPYEVSPVVGEYVKKEIEKGCFKEKVYRDFATKVYQVKENMLKWIREAKQNGKTISGYGAPAKGNTLICFCDLSTKEIDYIVDDNPLKQGLYSPGAHIPVVTSEYLKSHPTDFVIIFAWNFAAEIMKKLSDLKSQGVRFAVPLPELRLI